jgi:hypothetical protein
MQTAAFPAVMPANAGIHRRTRSSDFADEMNTENMDTRVRGYDKTFKEKYAEPHRRPPVLDVPLYGAC